ATRNGEKITHFGRTMKQTAEAYLGEKVTTPSSPSPLTSTTLGVNYQARWSDHCPYRQRTHHRPIAYGLDKNSRGADEFQIPDASPLTIENGVFEVLVTAGGTHLGGEDFVHHFVHHFAQDFKRQLKKDLPSNTNALPRQTTARERAKRTLFSNGLSPATTATSPFSAFGDMSNDVQ
ncbi:hypothetical protein FRC00_007756, partial [Tulasnella sp. 408]